MSGWLSFLYACAEKAWPGVTFIHHENSPADLERNPAVSAVQPRFQIKSWQQIGEGKLGTCVTSWAYAYAWFGSLNRAACRPGTDSDHLHHATYKFESSSVSLNRKAGRKRRWSQNTQRLTFIMEPGTWRHFCHQSVFILRPQALITDNLKSAMNISNSWTLWFSLVSYSVIFKNNKYFLESADCKQYQSYSQNGSCQVPLPRPTVERNTLIREYRTTPNTLKDLSSALELGRNK